MHTHCNHDHSHAHGHHHHHGHHSTADRGYGRIFLASVALNSLFIAIELYYGYISGSLALMADAGHNASDVAALLLAWGGMALAQRKPGGRYTYGLQSASIMAALINSLLLLVAVIAIAWEALMRLGTPNAPDAQTMIVVALIGTIINAATAWLLHRGQTHDLNIRGAYLHMAADALISLGVVISGVLIMLTGWLWLDAATSLLISLMTVAGTWRLLKDSLGLALHAVPAAISIDEVKGYLGSQNGVAQVHDLHVWAMSTTSIALSAHLLMPQGHPGDEFLHHVTHELAERFGIDHATLQIETSNDAQACRLSQHAE